MISSSRLQNWSGSATQQRQGKGFGMGHVLIVEDDTDSARMMAALVSKDGFSTAIAPTLQAARRMIAMQVPQVILLDLQLPDGLGLSLCEDAELTGRCEIVLMTAHASLETSIRALRLGAADYLIKPVNPGHLRGILARRMSPLTLKAELGTLRSSWESTGRFGQMTGRSVPMQHVYEQVASVAGTAISVFITGESGTGKELVARTVHDLSRRRAQPFLAVNCGAISPHLIESEIFGHEKGSFTGAERQHIGFFERAHGGTLFLDEITEMPPLLQVKLLRVLETGSFMRVGSTELRVTDVRIVAATNRDPGQAVAAGLMREDLLYRLNVFPLHLPPLRERLDDLPILVERFLDEIARREGARKPILPEALERLAQYRWPGNVRELRNVLQRAYVMAGDGPITAQWLPRNTLASPPAADPSGAGAAAASAGAGAEGARSPVLEIPVGTSLADVERQVILATFGHYQQQRERTAAALGVSVKTLYNKLKEYGD
jgi:DNA-binding NtrC family response regulator